MTKTFCPYCGGIVPTGERCRCRPRPKRKPTAADKTRAQREPWRANYWFWSSVILTGNQTQNMLLTKNPKFWSSVILTGNQTQFSVSVSTRWFWSSVILTGNQTYRIGAVRVPAEREVRLGFTKSGREVEMIGALLASGEWLVYHAKTPPTKKIKNEIDKARKRS